MNRLSRKLHELEYNILDFPPEDDDIMLHVGNLDEQLLHDSAQKIRSTVKDDAQAIIDSGTSPEQQNEAAKQLLSRLTDEENAILEQSHEFMSYRIERLVYKWFAAAYPKGSKTSELCLGFYGSSAKCRSLTTTCLIEDFEWNNNRNEDDPAFDDYRLVGRGRRQNKSNLSRGRVH